MGFWNEIWRINLMIWIGDQDLGLQQGLGLKLVNRLKITFELEVYLIGCEYAGFVGKYSRLDLTFLDYFSLD